MKTALISGITGQDGSYLAEFLLQKGYEVHGILRRSSSFNTGRIEHLYFDEWVRDMKQKRTINELRKEGVPLLEAIHEAGRRRLRPIIMTSLTTIFAMVPLLFSFDLGSELQKPLSIAMIGTMTIGTLVSLFIIPLLYWFIYRNKEKR